MTRAKALKKVAESAGTLAIVKDPRKPGGWTTISVAARRARCARYRRSAKGRARDARRRLTDNYKAAQARYRSSEKGRAAAFRADRKLKTGAKLAVTASDLAALRQSQGQVCPITNKPLDSIPVANDHAHDDVASGPGCLRGVIHRAWNSVLGRTDAELFEFARRLSAYASKRSGVLIRRACRPISKPRRAFKRRLRVALAEVARKALLSS